MSEQWQSVAGYEGAYEVSDLGRVRSLPGAHRHAKVLKGQPVSHGYLTVSLCNGTQRRFYVAHLVARAFIGERPDGMDVCRSNGDMLDNRAENLRYDTVNGNMRDCIRHGTHQGASLTSCSQGHEYTPENTYVRTSRASDGGIKTFRHCRTCTNTYQRAYQARKKVAA